MSIKKRGKTWWIDITTPSGERVRKSARTQLKKEAQEFHDKYKAELWRQHQLGEKVKVRYKWEEAVVRYLQLKEDKKWNKGLRDNLKDLHKWLSGRYLDDIDGQLISSITFERKAMKPRSNSGKGKTVSNATVNRMLAVLRAILKIACEEWEWIDRTPKVKLLEESIPDPKWLSKDDFSKLLDELPHHLKPMALFSVLTGLRMSNVTGLTWDQINFSDSIISFRSDDMKNKEAFSIPVTTQVLEVLLGEKGKHPEYVFTFQGKPIKNANTRAFKKALERAGLPQIRWHELRHTFASWHRQQNTPLHVLQALGGWKSEQMVKRYAHLNVEDLAKYANSVAV